MEPSANRSSKVLTLFKKLGVSLGAIVLTLLLLEVGFRLFYRDDTLTLDLDRELYWVPRAAQKTSTVTINGVGLRGKETAERDPSKFRVLVTGDSFTFGEKVNDDETYPAQLGALLDQEGAKHPGDGRPIEILNGAAPGWGVFQMERYLRRAIPRFQPDLVILAITPVDITRQPFNEKQLDAYMKAQTRRKRLRDTSVFATYMARHVMRVQLGHRNVPNEKSDDTNKLGLWRADAERIKKLVADFSGKTKIVLVVLQDFSKKQSVFANHARLFADEIHLDFLDVGPAFNGQGPAGFVVRGDGHPNAKGHAVAARAVADLFYAKGFAQKPGG